MIRPYQVQKDDLPEIVSGLRTENSPHAVERAVRNYFKYLRTQRRLRMDPNGQEKIDRKRSKDRQFSRLKQVSAL